MKNFNANQSGSEVILEEVNPYPDSIANDMSMSGMSYRSFTPLILTSIDPNIKPGDLIREDDLLFFEKIISNELVWVAKLKQGTEKDRTGTEKVTGETPIQEDETEKQVVILKSGSIYDNRLFDSLSQARNYVVMQNPKRKWKKSNNESEMVCALYGTKFIFQPLDQHK